jgi:5-hydroxyisourate hydrolase-like protein (transthyretin family)
LKRSGWVLILLVLFGAGGVGFLMTALDDGGRAGRVGTQLSGSSDGQADDGGSADRTGAKSTAGDFESRWRNDRDPNRTPGPPVTITGIVLRDGAPAKDAEVALFRQRSRLAPAAYRSDLNTKPPTEITRAKCKEGRFSFLIPRRTQVMVFADAPGCAFAFKLLTLPVEGDPAELTIELGDGHALAGKVIDEEKKPVAGVVLELSQNARRAPSHVETTTSNAEGLFRFDDIPDGNYWLYARPANYPQQRRWVYVPGTREALVELVAGGAITGTVKNDAGQPIAGAHLRFMSGLSGVSGPAEATTDASGHYRVAHAASGPIHSVTLEHAAYGMRASRRGDLVPPAAVIPKEGELKYDITLARGVPVTGVVVDTEGKAVAGATVALLKMSESGRTSLEEVKKVTADQAGRFVIPHVAEGTYGLEAKAEYATRRAQRTPNNQSQLTVDFFTDGQSPPPEQRLVVEATGTVTGRVEGADPAQYGGAINLNLQVGSVYRNTSTDQFGTFRLEHVPPTPETQVKSWNPALSSDPFAVVAGETVEVLIGATDNGGFRVLVLDDDGAPLPGAYVHLMTESGVKGQLSTLRYARGGGRTVTDREGRVLLPLSDNQRKNQSHEKWIVGATHLEYDLALSEAVGMPAAGDVVELELKLAAASTISGVVETAAGAPLPNVSVYAMPVKPKEAPFETRPQRYGTSDVDGRFVIHGVPDHGEYNIGAWKSGGSATQVKAGAGADDVRLVFNEKASITGFVRDEDGLPINQGRVYALIPTAGGKERKHGGWVQQGRFTLQGLEQGAYDIEVSPNSGRRSQGSLVFETKRVGPVPTGTQDYLITVEYGDKVTGRVLAGGKALGGAAVVAMPVTYDKKHRDRSHPTTITNGRGEFTLRGVTGEVELVASAFGYKTAMERAVPGGGPTTLMLDEGQRIAGKILKPDGTPVTNQWFNLRPLSEEVNKRFHDLQVRMGRTYGHRAGFNGLSGRTDGRGKFELTGLEAGAYRIWLTSEHGVTPEMTLTAGDDNVEVHLEPGLTIKGVIVQADGGPLQLQSGQSAWVNAQQSNRSLRGARPAGDGTFELRGMPPGNITLRVWAGNKYQYTTVEVAAGDQNVRIALEFNPNYAGKG